MSHNAFISYSHADDKRRERLHKHLVMLRREGLLQEWSDHEILPGDTLSAEISQALDQSQLFIALLSPDYLASRYGYETEFQRALQLQAEGRMRIVGVVVEPCDWQASPFGELLVLPKDGKAVSDWTNENTAYLNVVQELRRLLSRPPAPSPALAASGTVGSGSTTPLRRLRVRQDFDAIQKAEFADRAFEVMRRYFEDACSELPEASEHLRSKFEMMGATAFTCTVVNRARMRGGEAHITVRNNKGGRRGMSVGDLSFVYQQHADDGSSNGWLSVDADDYHLFLTGSIDRFGMGKDKHWTPESAAEALWNSFMGQAGIEFE